MQLSRCLVFAVDWIDVCRRNDENLIADFSDDDKYYCSFNISIISSCFM